MRLCSNAQAKEFFFQNVFEFIWAKIPVWFKFNFQKPLQSHLTKALQIKWRSSVGRISDHRRLVTLKSDRCGQHDVPTDDYSAFLRVFSVYGGKV